MSGKITDSFQNTLYNNVADESTESSNSGDISTSPAYHPADHKTAGQIPYIHNPSTDMKKRRRMH